MLAEAQRELLRGRQHRCNCIADLSRGIYLPVEITAVDGYVKKVVVPMGSAVIRQNGHVVLAEVDARDGEFESLRSMNPGRKVWEGKGKLVEKYDTKRPKVGRVHPSYQAFEERTDATKHELGEMRKYNGRDGEVEELLLDDVIGDR